MASRPMASPGMTSQCVLSSCCVLVVILKQSLSEAATISTDVSLPMNTSENVTVNETFEMATQEQFTNTTSGSTAATIASSTVVTNSTQDVEDHEDYTGVIVGSSVAGGLGVVLVTVCICCLIRSRLKVRRKQPSISTIYNTTDVDRLRNEQNLGKVPVENGTRSLHNFRSSHGRPFSPVRPASLYKESNYNINFGFLPSPVNAYTAVEY